MKRAAVFIGVNKYQDETISKLECAESDAVELYCFFKHLPGYNDVRLLLSPDREKILEVVGDIVSSLTDGDTLLIYFAGHDLESNNHRVLLCPRVKYSNIKHSQQSLPLDILIEKTLNKALNRVIILDTYRKSLLRAQRLPEFFSRSTQGIDSIISSHEGSDGSISIISTTKVNQHSLEVVEHNQGAFVMALIAILQDSLSAPNPVELSQSLIDSIIKRIRILTRRLGLSHSQNPWIATNNHEPVELIPGVSEKPFCGRILFKEGRIWSRLSRRFLPRTLVSSEERNFLSIDVANNWRGYIAAGASHSLCIQSPREIAVAGSAYPSTERGYCLWRGMKAIAAGLIYSIGLRQDGKVSLYSDRREYSTDWHDIVAIAAGNWHVVGLKSDGTVTAIGDNSNNQCEVASWRDICAVSAGEYHTVGLRNDGTVVAVGYSERGTCNTGDWQGIIGISAGNDHTVGLKRDGTVVAVGDNELGQCEVGDWIGISHVIADYASTIGIRSDGESVVTGDIRQDVISLLHEEHVSSLSFGGEHVVGLRRDGTVVAIGNNDYGQCNVEGWRDIVAIAAGSTSTLGLALDGTVFLVGDDDHLREVATWTNVRYLAAGACHSVGLIYDGTVVASGDNSLGQCNVESWKNILQVTAGDYHTVALRENGTVVAVGDNSDGQCNVKCWKMIRSIIAGDVHTIGLNKFGMALAVGNNDSGQCNLSNWRGVVSAAAGFSHSLGLRADGTVLAEGDNSYGQCNVSDWNNIVAISAASNHTVGLRSDGTVVAVGNNTDKQCDVSGWKHILAVVAGESFTLGIKRNGDVLATGNNAQGQCNVSHWRVECIYHEDSTKEAPASHEIQYQSTPETITVNLQGASSGIDMRLIPPGRYFRGSSSIEAAPSSNEIPRHTVWIAKPFYIGITPITQEQWRAIMGTEPSPGTFLPSNPVVGVSWEDCKRFLSILNARVSERFRLPTEAEWEYACRAGTETIFPWRGNYYDNEIDSFAWYKSNSKGVIHTVAQKKPNSWGLYDMIGNVYEWCSDWYGLYGQEEVCDPKGPKVGSLKIVRGGCYSQSPHECRPAYRLYAAHSKRYSDVGFRIVKVLE